MSATEDLAPVITVDWEAVEADVGHAIDPDLRRVIGHEGSTTSVALDRWGYGAEATTALFTAVKDHGRVIHPDLGALDPRYAPLRSMGPAVSVLRKLRGEDLNIGTIIDDGDDDWRVDQHPAITMGSYGPDQLGNLSVYVGHADQSVIEGINVEGLPVEREQTLAHGRNRRSAEEYFTATFRHERYYPEGREPTVADERAEEIGFLGSNAGKRTLEQDFRENEIAFEELGTVELGPADPDAAFYEYEKGEETRYGVEWTQRIAIGDYVVRSLIFDERPDSNAVGIALTIEDHRRDEKTGGRG